MCTRRGFKNGISISTLYGIVGEVCGGNEIFNLLAQGVEQCKESTRKVRLLSSLNYLSGNCIFQMVRKSVKEIRLSFLANYSLDQSKKRMRTLTSFCDFGINLWVFGKGNRQGFICYPSPWLNLIQRKRFKKISFKDNYYSSRCAQNPGFKSALEK